MGSLGIEMLTRVFVYGTLKPGECNYPLYCKGKVIHAQKVYTYGQLYDLSLGYPALTTGSEKVYGYLLIFSDDSILIQLDRLEDYYPQGLVEENEYDRRLIPLFDLTDRPRVPAWAYLMSLAKIQALGGVLIASGWWTNPGRSPIFVDIEPTHNNKI